MKKIVIVGCGPRGLALALQASLLNYDVTVIDPYPLTTWTSPNMLEDMLMRSPISFDLTTFIPELKNYSLSNFLNKPESFNTQLDVESCPTLCSRIEFIQYLKYIFKVIQDNKVHIKYASVTSIELNSVKCSDDSIILYDYLIICSGKNNHKIKVPFFLTNKKIITIKDILTKNYTNKIINVFGSGQLAAEAVEYISRKNIEVYWIQKHNPLIEQYPIPSIKNWGIQSALSNYYSGLNSLANKEEYLMKVKKWGPSITPYINKQLSQRNYTVLNPSITSELNLDAYNLLATGSDQRINSVPFNFNIELNKQASYFPAIKTNFQSTSHPNIYFSGLLALHFDGPRQGSIISSASTAQTILNTIN